MPVELNISLVFNILDLIEFYKGGDGDEVADIKWSIVAATYIQRRLKRYWIVVLVGAQGI